MILLRVVDNHWMDHIDAMDDLKQGIGLRALGQINPANASVKASTCLRLWWRRFEKKPSDTATMSLLRPA